LAKVRVFELAKELNLESKNLLTMLHSLGVYVRSASSTIEASDVQRVTRSIKNQSPRPTRPQPAPSTVRADDDTPDPIEQAIRRELGVGSLPPANSRQTSNPFAGSHGQGRRPVRSTRPNEPRPPDPWALALFDPDERAEWEAVGIYEAARAEFLVSLGLSPDTYLPWREWQPLVIKTAHAASLTPEDLQRRITPTTAPIGMLIATGSTIAEINELHRRHSA